MSVNKNINTWLWHCLVFVAMSLTISCTKLVEIDPPSNTLVPANTFSKEENATAAALGAYDQLKNLYVSTNSTDFVKLSALYPDEYVLTSTFTELAEVYNLSLVPKSPATSRLWDVSYLGIFDANTVMEGIQEYGKGLSPFVKDQLIGEAKLLRAWYHFNLVNLYGDVPLILQTDYLVNKSQSKTAMSKVYEQILDDLNSAKRLLSADYLDSRNKVTAQRLRANKDVATALLAKVYLYQKEWQKAETAASEVIGRNSLYSLNTNLATTFDKNNKEVILQYYDNVNNWISNYRLSGAPITSFSAASIGYLSDATLNQFEAGDKRMSTWITSIVANSRTYHYPVKYTSDATQYLAAMRLAELYLIRAEARIQQNKVSDGISDLNVLRTRARAAATVAVPNPLPDLPLTLSQADAMLALEKEWTCELFMEGHRWFNLVRWKGINNTAATRADELMQSIAAAKGSVWKPYMKLLPIPQADIELNNNLVQNPGY